MVVAAFVLASGAGASAHRYDELLQATRIGVQSNRVRLEMDLTPGIAVAPAAIREIDVNGDGVFSSMERRAYAEAVLNNISVRVDEGSALPLTIADSNFPAPATMRNGDTPISITLQAELPRLGSGAHHLRFRNDNATAGSAYLANALVPDTPHIAITSQHRDADQRELTIAFTLRGARSFVAELGWIAAAGILLLALPLARRSERSTRFLLSDERGRHVGAVGSGMFLGDVGGELVHRDLNAAKPAQGLTRGNVNSLHLPLSMGGSGSRVKNPRED